MNIINYIDFSDSAKYAEAAKNLLLGNGLTIHHSFFNSDLISNFHIGQSFFAGFLPVTSYLLAFIFRIFGASDISIFFTGLFFYFLCVLLIFLITKTLASPKDGIISVCLFVSSLFFHDYLANFASEIPFMFEILLFTYLFLKIKNPVVKWPLITLAFIAAFFTRQQTAVVLTSFFISLIVQRFAYASPKAKKKVALVSTCIIFFGIISLFFTRNSLSSPLYLLGGSQISTREAPGAILRGGQISLVQGETFISKIFYNAYNFAKAPERLASPAIFFLFITFLFLKSSSKKIRFFKLFSGFSLALIIVAASATLPNARYIHPVMPLIYIGSGIALVEIGKLISHQKIINATFVLCTLLLIVLPTIGHYTLDARAISRTQNLNQPPVYRQIAKIMAENIPQGHLIVTNLDSWAAWYEGLTTMWFPLNPEMLDLKNKPEYIVITNYLEGDQDFALGAWQEVVYNPEKISNRFLKENYTVTKTFIVHPTEDHENLEIKGTILKLK